jgi:hypothetical protein
VLKRGFRVSLLSIAFGLPRTPKDSRPSDVPRESGYGISTIQYPQPMNTASVVTEENNSR